MPEHPTVLITEDSTLTRLNLKTMLSAQGYAVTEAVDGIEAKQQVASAMPDVVLMDIGLPGIDGIQTTRQLRAQWPSLKVVMLTSHEADAEVVEAFQAGANSYCLKDTEPEHLLTAITQTLEGHSWIDPRVAQAVLRHLGSATPTAQTAPLPASVAAGKAKHASDTYWLTERELEILHLMTEGLNTAQLAERLCISNNTLKTHLKNIFAKLGVEDRTAAALKAIKEHLV
jgi:DNA-binding NarL/FixJ family response regulator